MGLFDTLKEKKDAMIDMAASTALDKFAREFVNRYLEGILELQNIQSGDLQNRDFVPAGHGGSHPYLVHEFVTCVATGRRPLVNAWEAGHYMAMGVAADISARHDGELTPVQDWGYAPEL